MKLSLAVASILMVTVSAFAFGSKSGDYVDTHPELCQQYRAEARQDCRGDSDCYTSVMSKFVDQYNSFIQYSEIAVDLYCNN